MATEVKKPTSFTEGALLLWADEANAYDTVTAGDETTYCYSTPAGDEAPSITFDTWGTKGQTYTTTVLKVKWDCVLLTGDDTWDIEYTKNGGSNWYALLAIGLNRSASIVTTQIALDSNQDLTNVEIRINVEQLKGADGHTIRIYDIWTEGTYTEVAIKLHYRKSDTTTDIDLYDTEDGAWHDSIRVRVNDATWYAQLDSNISHVNASDLRMRVDGTTYAVLTTSGTPS